MNTLMPKNIENFRFLVGDNTDLKLFFKNPSVYHLPSFKNPPPFNTFHSFKEQDLNFVMPLPQILTGKILDTRIIIARPLNELIQHAKKWEVPSYGLVARCIKTLVLAIFKWHLCDEVMLCENGESQSIIHSLNGTINRIKSAEFISKNPYILQCSFVYELKDKSLGFDKGIVLDGNQITPDYIRNYYHKHFSIEITSKEKNNSVRDLMQSNTLVRTGFHAC